MAPVPRRSAGPPQSSAGNSAGGSGCIRACVCLMVTAVLGAALVVFAAPSRRVDYSDLITGLRVDAGWGATGPPSPGPRLLVNPLVPACPNVTTDSCHELPPHDAPMGWGSVRLCDVPWGPGPMQGEYYQWLPAFVKAIPTSPGRPFVLDVGGNVGFFMVAIASAGLRVASFEPLPRHHEFLARHVCANAPSGLPERATIVPTALGAKTLPGGVVMKVPDRSDSANVLGEAAPGGGGGGGGGAAVTGGVATTVPLVSIDDWIESYPAGEWDPADLVWIKMDVQGYESLVLEGAERLLRKATHPLFRITAEENEDMWKGTKGAVAPSAWLGARGFVSASRTDEGDAIWVNPKTFRGGSLGVFPRSIATEKRPAEWWAAGGTLLPAMGA